MIRLGILGYGNLGRGVECAVKHNPDTELVAVFTRRDPSTVEINSNAKIYSSKDLAAHKDEIEAKLGVELNWWRFDKGKASYIDYHVNGIGMDDETRWEEMAEFHAEWSKNF